MKYLAKLNFLLISSIYALILLISEYAYRFVFSIPSIRNLGEAFLLNIIFIILMIFAKYRFTKFVIWFFFTVSILSNNVHYEIYKSWINATNYLLMFIEAGEVTSAGMSMINKLIIPVFWAGTESLIFLSLFKVKLKKTSIISDILFFVLIIFICARSFNTTQQHGISPNPDYNRLKAHYFSFGYFVGRTLPYHVFDLSNVKNYLHDEPKVLTQPQIKNIIYIIGESQNTKNMGVFGYPRNTTPFLSSLNKDEVIIKPSYSAATMTAVSLPTFFNAIAQPNGAVQISRGSTNLFYLAKQQGYSTQFYTAQAERQMMIMNIIGLRWIDKMVFPTDLGYSKSDNMPDTKLLSFLQDIDFDNQSNFVVLHQRGSHVPYGELLDDDEHVFGNDTIINKYDNTIRKTDLFIQSVFDYLRARGKDDWMLVFTSDHGQNVSNDTFNHGGFTPSSYLVPAFIYTDNKSVQAQINQNILECKTLFHQQLATLVISSMGYDMPISDCKIGYVNGNLLSGDSGYLKVNQETDEIEKIYATAE